MDGRACLVRGSPVAPVFLPCTPGIATAVLAGSQRCGPVTPTPTQCTGARYGEPPPERTVALLEVLATGSVSMQKFILLGDQVPALPPSCMQPNCASHM